MKTSLAILIILAFALLGFLVHGQSIPGTIVISKITGGNSNSPINIGDTR